MARKLIKAALSLYSVFTLIVAVYALVWIVLSSGKVSDWFGLVSAILFLSSAAFVSGLYLTEALSPKKIILQLVFIFQAIYLVVVIYLNVVGNQFGSFLQYLVAMPVLAISVYLILDRKAWF